MAIGIISAMKEEMHALLQELQLEKKLLRGMRSYYLGTLYKKEVVLVFSRWGKVASSTTVTQLINEFDIEEIIFTGVAGAIVPQVAIGDIILARNLYQHDMDGSPIVKKFEIPLLGRTGLSASADRRQKFLKAASRFLDQRFEFLQQGIFDKFEITSPKVHQGDIASGDLFISTKEQSDRILNGLPTVLCVEMEGAAVAQVCFEYGIPFSVIRTISDNANQNAHIDFPKFAREVASNYALGILKFYLS